jgi:hypothetical protein
MVAAFDERGAEAVVAEQLVDDADLEAGIADGSLVVDTRLRDALRGPMTASVAPTLAEDVAVNVEASEIQPSDSVVRLGWNVGRLEKRLAKVANRR